MPSARRDQRIDLIAQYLYNVRMEERETWAPETCPPGQRRPWATVARAYKHGYRAQAAELLEVLEGPGVGGTPQQPPPGR